MTEAEIYLQSRTKLANLEEALLEATRLEGYDHVQPAMDCLMGYLVACQHSEDDGGFDLLMSAIGHVGWLLKHKANEVHALRLRISKLCPSDFAAQIVEGCELGMAGLHAASFHCPVCDASRPNHEAPGRRHGTAEVLQRICDDRVECENRRSMLERLERERLERQAIARKQAAMEALADGEHAGRSRPVWSSWWRRLTTWRRHRLPAARLVEPSGRDPEREDTT